MPTPSAGSERTPTAVEPLALVRSIQAWVAFSLKPRSCRFCWLQPARASRSEREGGYEEGTRRKRESESAKGPDLAEGVCGGTAGGEEIEAGDKKRRDG